MFSRVIFWCLAFVWNAVVARFILPLVSAVLLRVLPKALAPVLSPVIVLVLPYVARFVWLRFRARKNVLA